MTRGPRPVHLPLQAEPQVLPVDEMHYKLEGHERSSGTWLRMRAHLQRMLEKERNRLEHMPTPGQKDQTDFIRGGIAMLRQVLEFDKDPPPVELTDGLE